MNIYVKILLVIAGLAYLISPFDIIPDLLFPFIGWIDDSVIIGVLIYILRYGKLPDIFKKGGKNGKFAHNQRDSFHKGSSDAESNSRAGASNRNKSGFNDEPRQKDPYEILGVGRDATREEIQSAYKEKVKQYHPDRVSSLGEELQEMANRKFVEIKDAYDTLMKQRR
ncbi:MAG: DnaJ domain-containing protein [Desulfobacteraceae bacterium]